jgi:hypothetical protein
MSVISSLSKRGQYSTVSRMSEVPVTEGLILYLDSSDEASYDGGPTTNYFKPTEGTFDNNGAGTFQRLRSGSYGGYIIKPTDVVYRYDLGGTGCHYHGNSVPTASIGIGVTILFTFDYFISAGTVLVNDYLANIEKYNSAGTWTDGVGLTNAGKTIGVWQSATLSTTINSVDYYVNPYLYPGGCSSSRLAADGFILYRNPQIQALNYQSRFVYGPNGSFNTRNNGNFWRDLSGRGNDFTIQGNITWNKDTGFSNFNGNSVANGNKIFRSNFPQNLKSSQSGQGYTVVVVARSTVSGGWRKLIGNWDGDNYIDLYQNTTGNTWHQDGSGETLYVDGVQVGQDTYVMYNAGFHCYAATNLNNGTLTNPTLPLTIGNEPNGAANPNAYPWVGDIAVVLMYERVLTASEIKQISNLYKDKYGY